MLEPHPNGKRTEQAAKELPLLVVGLIGKDYTLRNDQFSTVVLQAARFVFFPRKLGSVRKFGV